MTLSNGVKVIVKKTDFKADQILFAAYAKGGTSVIGDDCLNELLYLPMAMSNHGLGTYTSSDLEKYLSGKQAAVGLSFTDYTRELGGFSTPKDLPTLMELIYMTMTDYTISDDDYSSRQNMYKGMVANQAATPEYAFQKLVSSTLYPNSKRNQPITVEEIDAARKDVVLDIVHKLTANAADYTFVFVGNVDIEALRPLLEQYIATLPADAATATKTIVDVPALNIIGGTETTESTSKMETPQTYVAIVESGNMEYTPKDRALADAAGQIWGKRLREKVREEMGAVYSIFGAGGLRRTGAPNVIMQSVFPMKPEYKKEVVEYIGQELKNMESDVKAEELSPVVEYLIKGATEGKETNDYWLEAIQGVTYNGVDTANGDIELYKSLTPADVMDFMKRLNAMGNYRVVILDPAPAE